MTQTLLGDAMNAMPCCGGGARSLGPVPDGSRYVRRVCRRSSPSATLSYSGTSRPNSASAAPEIDVAAIRHQFRDRERSFVLDDYETPVGGVPDPSVNSAGGTVTGTGFDAAGVLEENLELIRNPSGRQSGEGGVGRLRWSAAGPVYVSRIPAGLRDLRGFTHLSLRLSQPRSTLNVGELDVEVQLAQHVDGREIVGRVRAPAFSRVQTAAETGDALKDKASWATVRIPLVSFMADGTFLDLERVEEVRLIFRRAAGDVLVDDLEFVRGGSR